MWYHIWKEKIIHNQLSMAYVRLIFRTGSQCMYFTCLEMRRECWVSFGSFYPGSGCRNNERTICGEMAFCSILFERKIQWDGSEQMNNNNMVKVNQILFWIWSGKIGIALYCKRIKLQLVVGFSCERYLINSKRIFVESCK